MNPPADSPQPLDASPLAPLLDPPVVVVDAGCRWGATTAWAALQPGLRVYAFDADADECARLGALQQPDDPVRYVPTALAAHRGEAELKIAREPACSSFFPPDPLAMRERPELGVIETVGTARVPADRLDLWAADAGVPHIEAMKLDVQGAELLVLEGAGDLLDGVRAIEAEVSFAPIYAGQALFADVDAFLRARGFALWRLDHLVHYGRDRIADMVLGHTWSFYDGVSEAAVSRGGQLYWGHAHYVAADMAMREPAGWERRLRDAAICAGAGLADLAVWCARDALAAGAPPEAARALRAALGDDR